jgi:hypothetical protein
VNESALVVCLDADLVLLVAEDVLEPEKSKRYGVFVHFTVGVGAVDDEEVGLVPSFEESS